MLRIREYETIYIMRPDISDVDADRITDRVRNVISSHEGKILQIDNWGKRRLAYEIAKHQKGIYVHWRFVGNNEVVLEIERNLRLIEPVLRFLTVKLDEDVDLDSVTGLTDDQIPMRMASEAHPSEDEPDDAPERAEEAASAPEADAKIDAESPAEADAAGDAPKAE